MPRGIAASAHVIERTKRLIKSCSVCPHLRASLSPYGDWQLMAVMVARSHWRCDRHALNWLQQKVEHAAWPSTSAADAAVEGTQAPPQA